MITFKSKEDFEKMSKAGKAVKNIHEQIHNHAKEGVSLKELDSLAKKVYSYLMISFKNMNSLMARAEQSILHSLSHETRQTIELKGQEFEEVPIDRLLHEMSSRQKLIKKDKGVWCITDLGRTLINHYEYSE